MSEILAFVGEAERDRPFRKSWTRFLHPACGDILKLPRKGLDGKLRDVAGPVGVGFFRFGDEITSIKKLT